MSRILLVEDNRGYAETLKGNLELEGYEVVIAGTGVDGLALARSDPPDLIILDLMLPTMNGFTVLQRLRESGRNTPVLIMTALGAEDEKLRGFGLGADDYVVKPTGLLEILARVRALLKRSTGGASEIRDAITIDDIEVDLGARVVRRQGTELPVRPKEFDLLAALIRHRGKVVSKAQLLREVWGYASGTESRTVDTHVAALRQHLGDDPQSPRYIVTARGAGYRVV
ncbi:MAG: response regulator transcription factor [Gemmatimonadaceae bacterium]